MNNDNVNHPRHYSGIAATVECIDISRHMPFSLGNAFKYVWRAGKKGSKEKAQEDLEKALWYLQDWSNHGDPQYRGSVTAYAIWQTTGRGALGSTRDAVLDSIIVLDLISARNLIKIMMEDVKNESDQPES